MTIEIKSFPSTTSQSLEQDVERLAGICVAMEYWGSSYERTKEYMRFLIKENCIFYYFEANAYFLVEFHVLSEQLLDLYLKSGEVISDVDKSLGTHLYIANVASSHKTFTTARMLRGLIKKITKTFPLAEKVCGNIARKGQEYTERPVVGKRGKPWETHSKSWKSHLEQVNLPPTDKRGLLIN